MGRRPGRGRPGHRAIVATDLAELPYWRSRTRFGGHRVVVAGYDAARGTALLADTGYADLEEVPLEVLERARASVAPPFGAPGRGWLENRGAPAPARPRGRAAGGAPAPGAGHAPRRRGARRDLRARALRGRAAGVGRARTDEADRAWCFRYAYQVIELRGTGGGFFRKLYAAFLREAEALVPALAPLGLAARMEALAADWTRLGSGLRAVGDAPRGSVPEALARDARALAAGERRFFEDVAARVP